MTGATVWTDARLAELQRYRRAGISLDLIAWRMGLKKTQIKAALQRESRRYASKPKPAPKPLKRVRCLSRLTTKCLGTFMTSNPKGNHVCEACKATKAWRGGQDSTVRFGTDSGRARAADVGLG